MTLRFLKNFSWLRTSTLISTQRQQILCHEWLVIQFFLQNLIFYGNKSEKFWLQPSTRTSFGWCLTWRRMLRLTWLGTSGWKLRMVRLTSFKKLPISSSILLFAVFLVLAMMASKLLKSWMEFSKSSHWVKLLFSKWDNQLRENSSLISFSSVNCSLSTSASTIKSSSSIKTNWGTSLGRWLRSEDRRSNRTLKWRKRGTCFQSCFKIQCLKTMKTRLSTNHSLSSWLAPSLRPLPLRTLYHTWFRTHWLRRK